MTDVENDILDAFRGVRRLIAANAPYSDAIAFVCCDMVVTSPSYGAVDYFEARVKTDRFSAVVQWPRENWCESLWHHVEPMLDSPMGGLMENGDFDRLIGSMTDCSKWLVERVAFDGDADAFFEWCTSSEARGLNAGSLVPLSVLDLPEISRDEMFSERPDSTFGPMARDATRQLRAMVASAGVRS